MTFENAKEIGLGCGLTEPREWVNNALIHVLPILPLPYEDVVKARQQLIAEAIENGLHMCECGDFDTEKKELCYICEKLHNLKE